MDDNNALIAELGNITEILFDNGYGSWGNAIRKAIGLLRSQPQIVRCRDCKHRYDGEHVQNCCDEWMHKAGWKTEFSVDLDGFCNKGEPKEGEQE